MSFNFSEAVSASMKVSQFPNMADYLLYLESISEYKTDLNEDKKLFLFSDTSFLCCDGNSVFARPAGSDITEFIL